ncbi:4-hydroxy-tetrahydrodipicolinate synthase [Sporosarcina sp. NCCP-2222]|uniref:4-hydroxy-tetrahydrodipicolinate synthase n=1 Tax=Sporosarcina sp. NCCP-2222 TaxID=2935073 RepID=UPI0020895551|nr:4-hydroxy-tetrahydrodipicolinate synthase [Sporosarcina sp. NCCP-2222]GKV55537.1 4-hydroxy-tetrahydrodipicolinate synthase [Sporosarcina sp. NCCP-2222]
MELGQIGTAMVTPFSQAGDIDYERTEKLIEHLIQNGTDSLVVCGTTGESPTLTHAEKANLLKFSIDIVKKRIPVIAGTGTFNTAETVYLTKQAEQLGADGIMLVAPYYNKPDQKGMFAHFSYIATETSLPIMLYNIPGRSAVNMHATTVIELSKIKNIRAVKEASGSLDQMAEIISGTDAGFSVYSGDDALTLPVLAIGGKGIISVASHVVGPEMQLMINSFKQGKQDQAGAMHRALVPLFSALFSAPNPVPVKYALQKIGIETGGVRLPLREFGEDARQFDIIWDEFKQSQKLFV